MRKLAIVSNDRVCLTFKCMYILRERVCTQQKIFETLLYAVIIVIHSREA